MEDLKTKAVGHWDMTVKELDHIYSYWELKGDGKAIQDGHEQGTWAIMDDVVVITYHNKDHGHTVLSFDDDNTLLGENVWREGKTFTWTMRRVAV